MKYEIKERDLGCILDTAIALLRNHLGLLLGIMCVLLVPMQIVVGVLTLANMPELAPNASFREIFMARAMAGQDPIILILDFVLLLVALPLSNAATVYAVSKLYVGEPIGVGEAFGHSFKIILPFMGTGILYYLTVVGGTFLCFVPGVIIALWFALWGHVVIIEGISGIAALNRSKFLMSGNLGTLFVLGLLILVINFLFSLAAQFVPEPFTATFVSILISAVLTIFAVAAGVVFYFSCRCKAENFDLTLLANAVATGGRDVE